MSRDLAVGLGFSLEQFDQLADIFRRTGYDFERFGEVIADMVGLTSEVGPVPQGTEAPPHKGA